MKSILFSFLCIVLHSTFGYSIPILTSKNFVTKNSKPNNVAPILQAVGNQVYCVGLPMKVVTDFSISDTDDVATTAIYIQISAGYNAQTDVLSLLGVHPNVVASWTVATGKLELKSPTNTPVLYSDLVLAVKDVVYFNSSALPTGDRSFSITIGQNNFLPSNGHYYKYFSIVNIGWNEAKAAAEASTYYGLQGYLVTITSADEQQLVGEQSTGTGWIAGSDAETEGVWKWKSGPENGTVFFQNLVLQANGTYISDPTSIGTTFTFAFWNRTGQVFEPNNLGGSENYAHITAASVGLRGSWNDIRAYADPSSNDYQSKGYIAEYGGMPGDPVIQIAVFTKITIPYITATIPNERCGSGTVALSASINTGSINWYENEFGGVPVFTGNAFVTPSIIANKTYWVEPNYGGCLLKSARTSILAKVREVPVITTSAAQIFLCGAQTATISATSTIGAINWFETTTTTTVLANSNDLTKVFTESETYYAEAVNTPCSNGVRVPINVTVYKVPTVPDQVLVLCKGKNIVLDALYPNAAYVWSNGNLTETTEVSSGGIYTVSVTTLAPENCTSVNKITVIEKSLSPIKTVVIDENTVTIVLESPNLETEYSLDGINWQISNIFQNVAGGLQTAYIRDTNSCGFLDSFPFLVVDIPKFFTPNGDSYNDFWFIAGLNYLPNADIQIFDRFGKLLTQLGKSKTSWDGNFDGKPLPADDYWYVLKMSENKVAIKGHFTLKR